MPFGTESQVMDSLSHPLIDIKKVAKSNLTACGTGLLGFTSSWVAAWQILWRSVFFFSLEVLSDNFRHCKCTLPGCFSKSRKDAWPGLRAACYVIEHYQALFQSSGSSKILPSAECSFRGCIAVPSMLKKYPQSFCVHTQGLVCKHSRKEAFSTLRNSLYVLCFISGEHPSLYKLGLGWPLVL